MRMLPIIIMVFMLFSLTFAVGADYMRGYTCSYDTADYLLVDAFQDASGNEISIDGTITSDGESATTGGWDEGGGSYETHQTVTDNSTIGMIGHSTLKQENINAVDTNIMVLEMDLNVSMPVAGERFWLSVTSSVDRSCIGIDGDDGNYVFTYGAQSNCNSADGTWGADTGVSIVEGPQTWKIKWDTTTDWVTWWKDEVLLANYSRDAEGALIYIQTDGDISPSTKVDEIKLWDFASHGDNCPGYTVVSGGVTNPALSWITRNDTRNNTNPYSVAWNLTEGGCEYAEVYENATYKTNTSSVVPSQIVTYNFTLSDGSYRWDVYCYNQSVVYNMSYELHYDLDTAAPIITCGFPLCTNSSWAQNGTEITISYDIGDTNLDGANVSYRYLSGGSLYGFWVDNLTATNLDQDDKRNLTKQGTVQGYIIGWDDHNKLKDKEQIRRLRDDTTKIKEENRAALVTSKDQFSIGWDDPDIRDIDFVWNEDTTSWNQNIFYDKPKNKGSVTVLHVKSRLMIRPKDTGHTGHLILGNSHFYDIDGIDGIVTHQKVTDHYYILTIYHNEKTRLKETTRSYGELNIERYDVLFLSVAEPKLIGPLDDFTTNSTEAWQQQFNCSDEEAGDINYFVNDSIVSIGRLTGIVTDTPAWADNGTRSINMSCNSSYLENSYIWTYTINISQTNATPVINNKLVNWTVNGSWYYWYNVTDKDGDAVICYINESMISLTACNMSASPTTAENGTYWVRVNATDGNSWDTDIFRYMVQVPVTTTAVDTTATNELLYCLMFGNYTNSTACPNHNAVTKGDIMIGAIILIPLALGFMLLIGVVSFGKDHPALKIGLFLLALMTVLSSLQFALLGVVKYMDYPELQQTIADTTFWIGWSYFAIISYWIIHAIAVMVHAAAQKKQARLEY